MTPNESSQRSYADVEIGEQLGPVTLPLSIYRLVVAAGGNRDFNSIHHNPSYARSMGAPTSYASTFFLMGAWERLARDFIGSAGTIRSISDFRMRKFNLVGSVMTVGGRVVDKRLDGGTGVVTIEVACRVGDEVTVGPGQMVVTVPCAGAS
jgi:acyl dehydratase